MSDWKLHGDKFGHVPLPLTMKTIYRLALLQTCRSGQLGDQHCSLRSVATFSRSLNGPSCLALNPRFSRAPKALPLSQRLICRIGSSICPILNTNCLLHAVSMHLESAFGISSEAAALQRCPTCAYLSPSNL